MSMDWICFSEIGRPIMVTARLYTGSFSELVNKSLSPAGRAPDVPLTDEL